MVGLPRSSNPHHCTLPLAFIDIPSRHNARRIACLSRELLLHWYISTRVIAQLYSRRPYSNPLPTVETPSYTAHGYWGRHTPELFRRILFDVCEDADMLLNLRSGVPNRKEAIQNVTACSLTCVYWAHICRKKLFYSVWIKNYEDMRAFARLVPNTPTRFRPISEYVKYATLVQRVGDRPWVHLIRMQPSLFQFWRGRVCYLLHIEDSPNDTPSSRRSISQRLFASLPRTLPSSCLQCEDLTIDQPHFVTPHDLISFLQKFSPFDYLRLRNVAWSAQAHFASDLLTRDLLLIPPSSRLDVVVDYSAYAAETAWVAFSTVLRVRVRDLSTQGSTVTSASEYDAYDENERRPTLEVLSSAQRAIFDICKAVCKVSSLNSARFNTTPTISASKAIPWKGTRAYYMCNTMISGFEPAVSEIELVFCGTRAAIPVTNVSDSVVIDSISVLLAHIRTHPPTESSDVGHLSNKLPSTIASPWPEIVGLCAAQPEFMRLQLEFGSLGRLVQFMEAQRAAFGKLHGRIALFYYYAQGRVLPSRAADFETLADLGDASEHGYIDTCW